MIDWLRLCGQMAHNCLGTVCIADVDSVSFGLKLPISALSTTNTWAEFRCVFFGPKAARSFGVVDLCGSDIRFWELSGCNQRRDEKEISLHESEKPQRHYIIYIYISITEFSLKSYMIIYVFVCMLHLCRQWKKTDTQKHRSFSQSYYSGSLTLADRWSATWRPSNTWGCWRLAGKHRISLISSDL